MAEDSLQPDQAGLPPTPQQPVEQTPIVPEFTEPTAPMNYSVPDQVPTEITASPDAVIPEPPADPSQNSVPEPAPTPDESGRLENTDETWDMAHDEKYALDGKTELLQEPWHEGSVILGDGLDFTIDKLYDAYLSGQNVSVDFNGKTLNSREIGELGLNMAYEKYFGYDRENYQEHDRLEFAAEQAARDLEEFEAVYAAKKQVPELISETSGMIKPDAVDEWKNFLGHMSTDLLSIGVRNDAIALMRAHSQGATSEELKIMMKDQRHYGTTAAYLEAAIKEYYRNGDSLLDALTRS